MKPTPEERLAGVVRDQRRSEVPESLLQLTASLDEPPRRRIGTRMWSVAPLAILGAIVVAALWIGRSPAPLVSGPSATATPPAASSSASIPTASTTPTPAGVLGLAIGESQLLDCGDDFPSFSRDGRWLACGRQLKSWPDLTTVAPLAGSPAGWSADDQLLVLVGNSQYVLATPEGVAPSLNLKAGEMPEWSSDGRRLLIQSRSAGRLRVAVWSEDGTRTPIVDLPAGDAVRIDVSNDGSTVLRTSTSCSSPGGCRFAVTASRADGSDAVTFGPVPDTAAAHLADDGSYWFPLGQGTDYAMWAAPPRGMPRNLGEMRGSWPLADGGFAAANARGVWRWRPGSADLEPVALPDGVDPAAILALSPDLSSALVGPPSTAFVDLVAGTRIAGPDWANATAFWVPGGTYGIVRGGPPPISMIVRLR